MKPATVQMSIPLLAWSLLALLALIWGGSFLSNSVVLAEIGPLTIVAMRVVGASVALWVYVLASGLPVPKGRALIASLVVMGLLNNALPFSLIVWGQQHIASGLAGILNAATAVFTVLLAAFVFPDERLTPRKTLGVALGFSGVALAIGIKNLGSIDLTSAGQLAVLAAALSYAVSGIFARRTLAGLRPEVSAAGMLAASATMMLPLALWQDGLPTLDYRVTTWASVGYLALVASALAYLLFYKVLALAGAGNLSLVTLMVAPVAILLGALFLGEKLAAADYLGFALLALGLLVIDGRIFPHRPASA